MAKIGIIGGSGLYQIEGIKNVKEISVTTPFGEPSDKLISGSLEGAEVIFLARHGKGHRILPSELNYRANIFAMKKLGVEGIISFSACGSLKEELKPMDFVIPDQFVDRTNQARKMTFFGNGIVVHIAFAHPICENLAKIVFDTAKAVGLNVRYGATYINMEGPAFSTKAESNLYRSWDMDIIGMTNMAEAKLAREAEMCYVTVCAVTDYDCWHPGHYQVTVQMIIENLMKNVENSQKLIKMVIPKIAKYDRSCKCKDALSTSIITDKKVIPAKVKKDLEIIIGKYMK